MTTIQTLILRLDAAGQPLGWITPMDAAVLYCRDQVLWEAGQSEVVLRGGIQRRTSKRSVCTVNTIVAARGVHNGNAVWRAPALSNRALFRRDRHLCMYCGQSFAEKSLTRDHVIPVSRGGEDAWENVVSACRRCNQAKDNLLPEQAALRGLRLIAVPYAPSATEGLILANRRILADQMAFLQRR